MLRCGKITRQRAESVPQGLRQSAPLVFLLSMIPQRLLLAVLAFPSALAQAKDLSLAEAERLLGQQNRELIAARRAVESAGAMRDIAAVRPNPTLSLNSSSISS